MTTVTIAFRRLPHAADLPLPARATRGAAGLDLAAAVPADAPASLPPGGRMLVPTGFAMAIPDGYEGQVRPRSGLAVRHGVTVLNAPGTIDSDYRGEVQVLLVNHGDAPFAIERGMRIAQLVIAPLAIGPFSAAAVEVADLEATERGAGGFGSTGTAGLAPVGDG